MKKIITIVLIGAIIGGIRYTTKDFTHKLIFVGKQEPPTVQPQLPKAENVSTEKDEIIDGMEQKAPIKNNAENNSGTKIENSLFDIQEIAERLEKSIVTYQTETGEYIMVDGNIANIRHTKAVNKITVTACKGNLGSVYGSPYVLKSYEYPYFEYKIQQSFNNVCRIPYKITFYDKNDTEITTIDLKIPSQETQKIMK